LQPSPSLKARAQRWLAQREHSRAELERKLLRWLQAQAQAQAQAQSQSQEQEEARAAAPSPGRAQAQAQVQATAHQRAANQPVPPASQPGTADVARVLDQLAAAGLLSDERAAASLLHSQAARSGQRRLQQLLQAKGLPDGLVRQSLAEVRGTEFDRAWALWQRRYGQPPRDAAERARQQRFLAARGFDFDIVGRVLRRASATPDAPEAHQDS
jgi:regulatory protein